MNWHGRRYYSFDSFLKNYFGRKLYKVSLDGGFTCPNRDGTLGSGGCIFCSAGGSGEFASDHRRSITDQITQGIGLVSHKTDSTQYIAYFQAFTNTYGPIEKLRALFYEAIRDPRISALSIATRPASLYFSFLSVTIKSASAKRLAKVGYSFCTFASIRASPRTEAPL